MWSGFAAFCFCLLLTFGNANAVAVVPLLPGPGTFTLIYETSWPTAYLHYNASNRGWNLLPGAIMSCPTNTSTYPCDSWREITVVGNQVEWVITDGTGDWDNNRNHNYYANKCGIYQLQKGNLTMLQEFRNGCAMNCLNYGICENDYTCTCNPGFYGSYCQFESASYLVLINTSQSKTCATQVGSAYVAFVVHGNAGLPREQWSFSIMKAQWWNPAIAAANISAFLDNSLFEVQCLGQTFTCGSSSTPSAACFNSYFNVTEMGANIVIDLPSSQQQVASVVSNACTLVPNSFRTYGGPNSQNALFVPGGGTAQQLGELAPCSGNGQCQLETALCACYPPWTGALCEKCNCSEKEFCAVGSKGGTCLSEPPSGTVPGTVESAVQGVSVIIATRWWFGALCGVYGNSTLHFNSGNITTDARRWSDAFFRPVNASDPRIDPSVDVSAYANEDWMIAIVPAGTLLQFVIYLPSITTYIHCDPSISINVQSGVLCLPNDLNGNQNFVSTAGVTVLSNSSFFRLKDYPGGCQYSVPPSVIPGSNSSATATTCSAHGECNQGTFFTCNCIGNFTGVACESCQCPYNLTCLPDGSCACSQEGYLSCHSHEGTCIDVMNDPYNCGACDYNCAQGVEYAVESMSCVAGGCVVRMKSPLSWKLCTQTARGEDVACFRGYDFLIIMLLSLFLFSGSLLFFLRYRTACPHSHQHRQALFVLLAFSALLRLVYAVVAIAMFYHVQSPVEARESRRFFEWTMITLNGVSDLLTGFIDLLLTVYWLFVLDQITMFPTRLLYTCYTIMTVSLVTANIVDYSSDAKNFDYTMFTIALLLFFTALLHMTVIIEVIAKLSFWSSPPGSVEDGLDNMVAMPSANPHHRASPGLSTSKFKRLSSLYSTFAASPDEETALVRMQLMRICAIAFICLLCWAIRSVMLLGRAAGNEVFVTGSWSFANPNFVLIYFTLLTMGPSLIIALVFFKLSFPVISRKAAVHHRSFSSKEAASAAAGGSPTPPGGINVRERSRKQQAGAPSSRERSALRAASRETQDSPLLTQKQFTGPAPQEGDVQYD